MSKAEQQAETDLLYFFRVMIALTKEQRALVLSFLHAHHASTMAAESGPTPGGSGDTGQ